MTCEIRVSTHSTYSACDESVFSINNGSPDQAGALVALAARKALEGSFSNRFNTFEEIIIWLEDCQNWELLPNLDSGHEVVYYYHIKLSNDRNGKLEIEIGFSQQGLAVKYFTVNEFIKEVNTARKEYNQVMLPFLVRNWFIPSDHYYNARMLRKVNVS